VLKHIKSVVEQDKCENRFTSRCIPHACTEEHEKEIVTSHTFVDFFHYGSIELCFNKGRDDA
jgi:hypothetical protein